MSVRYVLALMSGCVHVSVSRFSIINTSGVCLHAQYQFGKLSFTKIYTQILRVCIARRKDWRVCVYMFALCVCVCVITMP